MENQNSYLVYKRDTNRLVYWIINASNAIIEASRSRDDDNNDDTNVEEPNVTGKITVANLVSLSKLIAKHVNPIPTTIYRLFCSVIDARKAFNAAFERLVKQVPDDAEIVQSNRSHKFFIDALSEAFKALGGNTWLLAQGTQNSKVQEDEKEEIEQISFENKFDALSLGLTTNEKAGVSEEEESDQDSQKPPPGAAPRRTVQRKPGKGKKGKRNKKEKKKQKTRAEEAKPSLQDVSLESYRIIEDKEGIITDYLMAIYAFMREWMDLRGFIQEIWHDVAYDGLNGAVAGTLSNMTLAMIKRMESSLFVDFPGHESYEVVMDTITRGNVERAQGMFLSSLYYKHDDGTVEEVTRNEVDLREQLGIYAYENLVDFITDFQKTRSGKPTKSMLAEIRNWDPNFNLQNATKKERIRWRRSYIINWLYDLVNIFSCIVVQRNTMKGQNWDLAKVDWSIHGPWHKPGSADWRHKIMPHHVFELQCIVDSLTVSRGWSHGVLRGHVLTSPANNFRPRRDVDLFLDRKSEILGSGYLQAVFVLKQLFDEDSKLHGDPDRHDNQWVLLESSQYDFTNWLGETRYMFGLDTIPPSTFSNTNANGLWEYSPYLCGTGLMEALEIAHALGILVWDRIPEVMLAVHLHNMLVKKGYLGRFVGLFATLEDLFPSAFFVDGKPPTSNFTGALEARTVKTLSYRAKRERQAIARHAARTGTDFHDILDPKSNMFFTEASVLRLYRQAQWDYERVSEREIPVPSALATIRLKQTKVIVDPLTGKKTPEDTELVRRYKAIGMKDEDILFLLAKLSSNQVLPIDRQRHHNTGHKIPENADTQEYIAQFMRNQQPETVASNREVLEGLKLDIYNDVCTTQRPVSSLNYLWVAVRAMMLFDQIEGKLRSLRNPLYVEAYETESPLSAQKRLSLTRMALAEQNTECLEVMAQCFEDNRTGFILNTYWQKLDETENILRKRRERETGSPPDCVVM